MTPTEAPQRTETHVRLEDPIIAFIRDRFTDVERQINELQEKADDNFTGVAKRLDSIHTEVKLTNSRVTKIENRHEGWVVTRKWLLRSLGAVGVALCGGGGVELVHLVF